MTRRGCEHAIVPALIPPIFRGPDRGLDFRPGFSEISLKLADFNALLYFLNAVSDIRKSFNGLLRGMRRRS